MSTKFSSRSEKSAERTHERPASDIRAIIIDPFRREVREAWIANDLYEMQFICGGGYLEFGIWINRREPLYVNEWASWPERFIIGGIRSFSGCGLITGADADGDDGDATSAKVSVQEIRNVVIFPPAKAF